ncbi:hypothetical protein [Pseudomonas sp.]|uniref:hypothetical protein n=1 Tax=Pseudomonas sp. TaxID=306 RepID=UPI00333E9FBA
MKSNIFTRYTPHVLTGSALLGVSQLALADAAALTTAATGAIEGAEGAAYAIGAIVVVAVAAIVTVGIVLAMMRKA